MADNFLPAGQDPDQPDSADQQFEQLCEAIDLNDVSSLERLREAAPTPMERDGIDQVIALLKRNRGVQNG